jgi:hypothetical protein
MADDEIFDFGFSVVGEEEISQPEKNSIEELKTENKKLWDKVDELYASILPLLDNLKKNPEKDFIKWPNRVDKIKEFEKKLIKIIDS